MLLRSLIGCIILMKPDDGGAGGGGATPKSDAPSPEFEALKKENEAFKLKIAEFEKSKPKTEPTLNDRVKETDDAKAKVKGLESAIEFNYKAKDFLKDNESIMPKDVAEIFKAADKENYDSAVSKAQATKAAIVQSFFAVQENLDLLTPSHKSSLEDFLKLTKTVREEKANQIFENVFEPALEMLKRVKKAQEVGRAQNGHGTSSDEDKAYKEKLIAGSKKHYLGEK